MIEWLDEVDGPTRLYLMGHGDWKTRTLAGHTAKAYSEMFRDMDLRWLTLLRIWGVVQPGPTKRPM